MKRLALAAVLLSAAAYGQALELAVSGGQTRMSNGDLGNSFSDAGPSDDYSLKGGFRLAMRMTLNAGSFTGHEFGYGYNRSKMRYPSDGTSTPEYGTSVHQGFYNYLLYPTREGSRIRPFVTGGVHFNNYILPGYSVTSGGGSTKFGVNYGGGLKIKVSSMFLIRFDVRQYMNGKPFNLYNQSGTIKMNEFSAGVGFTL